MLGKPAGRAAETVDVGLADYSGKRRQPARFGDTDVIAGSGRLAGDGDQIRIVGERDPHRFLRRCGERGERRRRRELARRMADLLPVRRFARRQLTLRRRQLRTAVLKPRFGLGDVGAGEIADLETVARGLEIGLEHLHIVLIELDHGAVADHVHVGRYRLGEDVAFDGAQRRSARLDARFSGSDGVLDAAAVE